MDIHLSHVAVNEINNDVPLPHLTAELAVRQA